MLKDNPVQFNYGVAVTDVDGDGEFEFFVAGFGARNQALKWDGQNFYDVADETLADFGRQAIGVAAADFNGDGQEEIYILNTDTFSGEKRFGDRLMLFRGAKWVDLFSVEENKDALNLTAGRSVCAVDRFGSGQYGFFIANYGGPLRLYELNGDGLLQDAAPDAGLNLTTGGRGLVSLPLISNRMDVFAGNENMRNFLFVNQGDGTFAEVAEGYGLEDPYEHVRGIAPLDANHDGRIDLVYGNWEGHHRLFVRADDEQFNNSATPELAHPARVRTVIAADFDNDGYEEIFFNNIGEPNRLFAWRDDAWQQVDIGEAAEPGGLGTGAAVADLDGDGSLELLIAHGETGVQPLTLYQMHENDNNWLRVLPLTLFDAPARGALVYLYAGDRVQVRAIDAGSGYLCQMEPVAHFGLGQVDAVDRVEVQWPDGATKTIEAPQVNSTIRVPYPNA